MMQDRSGNKKKNPKNQNKPRTVEAFIALGLALFFILLLLGAFGKAGKVVSDFFTGVFGYAMIGYAFAALAIGVLLLFNFHLKKSWRLRLLSIASILTLVLLFQVISSKEFFSGSYGDYLKLCYTNAQTAGGLLAGLVAYPIMKLNYTFAIVLFSLLFAASLGALFVFEIVPLLKNPNTSFKSKSDVVKYKKHKKPQLTDLNGADSERFIGDHVGDDLFVANIDGTEVKDKLGKKAFKKAVDYTPIEDEQDMPTISKAKGGALEKIFDDNYLKRKGILKDNQEKADSSNEEINPRKQAIKKLYEDSKKTPDITPKKEEKKGFNKEEYRAYTNNYRIDNIISNISKTGGKDDEDIEQGGDIYDSIVDAIKNGDGSTSFSNDSNTDSGVSDIVIDQTRHDEGPLTGFLGGQEKTYKPSQEPKNDVFNVEKSIENRADRQKPFFERFRERTENKNINKTPSSQVVPNTIEPIKEEAPVKMPYKAPPVSLLRDYPPNINANEDFTEKAEVLENTLATFGINATVIGYKRGPSFTRFELQMPAGVSVKKVATLSDDIAMCMEATSIRIQAPIPGKNAVGVEIPNEVVDIVGMKDLICSPEFNNTKQSISFVLGKDIDGACHIEDLTKMPHMLIAGSTGSGKSVGINALICSILYKYSPDEVKLILIDPKMVDLNVYSGLPHMVIRNIITEDKQVIKALDWAINEMMDRYALIQRSGTQKLTEYNEWAKANGEKTLPFIVIVVDEFAELMERIKKDLEDKIKRLTQAARAAGIHLVIATQRPSVDVITGVIKSNLPTRVAFKVASQVDSRTILNTIGAEKLLGDGDMLFSKGTTESVRLQGAFLSGNEVSSICDYIRKNNVAFFNEAIEAQVMKEDKPEVNAKGEDSENSGGYDKDFLEAVRIAIDQGTISISKLQRKMTIGYPKAARIIDMMEDEGFISGENGSKPREVLITMEEYNNLLSIGDEDEL